MPAAASPLSVAGRSPASTPISRLLRLHRPSVSRSELSPNASLEKKRVVVVGAGWAGLAASDHLIKQGYDVTLLEAGTAPSEEFGPRGFWYPYRNIFALVDELGIDPFTKWTKASYYSPEGLAVDLPIFQGYPRIPTPLGLLAYPQFRDLPLLDQLTALQLLPAIIDFDNSDTSWRKYDAMTARELFKISGCSRKLYEDVLGPAIQACLLSPTEQCSAAATLGVMYYYAFAHQQNMDFLLCRGEIEKTILSPWLEVLEQKGLKLRANMPLNDFSLNEETGCISEVTCGKESYDADAFIIALGVSSLQSIIMTSPLLQSREEFLNVLKLLTLDVVSVRLWFATKIIIPKAANLCFGFDNAIACTFFDVSTTYDEYSELSSTILDVELYSASHLLPLKDEQIVEAAIVYVSKCIQQFREAAVIRSRIVRLPNAVTHFTPGSYKYMMRGSTSFPNLFMAGDWIVNRHGSFAKEKAYVTGLEAANRVIDYVGTGDFAKIIAVENDEPHIEQLRSLNRRASELRSQFPLSDFFL